MIENLTKEEETVRDLAIAHMKEQGQKLHVTFIAAHGFQDVKAYFLIGRIICPDCGGAHTGVHMLYMCTPEGLILVPEMGIKRVNIPQDMPAFNIWKILNLQDWP